MGLIHEVYERVPRLASSRSTEQFKLKDKPSFPQKVEASSKNNTPKVQDSEKTIPSARFFMPEMLE